MNHSHIAVDKSITINIISPPFNRGLSVRSVGGEYIWSSIFMLDAIAIEIKNLGHLLLNGGTVPKFIGTTCEWYSTVNFRYPEAVPERLVVFSAINLDCGTNKPLFVLYRRQSKGFVCTHGVEVVSELMRGCTVNQLGNLFYISTHRLTGVFGKLTNIASQTVRIIIFEVYGQYESGHFCRGELYG